MINKKAITGIGKMLGLILAMVVLFFVVQAIFPPILEGSTSISTLGCNALGDSIGGYLFTCNDKDIDQSNKNNDDKKNLYKDYDKFNQALRDDKRFLLNEITKHQFDSIKYISCVQKMSLNDGNKKYLFSGNIGDDKKPIYLFSNLKDNSVIEIFIATRVFDSDTTFYSYQTAVDKSKEKEQDSLSTIPSMSPNTRNPFIFSLPLIVDSDEVKYGADKFKEFSDKLNNMKCK